MTVHGVSSVPREARPYQGHRAGVVSRCLAAAVDLAVVIGVVFGAYAGWAAFLFVLDPRSFRFPDMSWLVGFAIGWVVSVVYLTFAWFTTGRTFGNHVMGLRVVSGRGGRIRLLLALLRALAYCVFPIGLFWATVSRDNRSLPDVVLRTSVIYDWQQAPEPLSGGITPRR
jgi:uncharacterized RDD family membrane protein YckC